jgi:uncharacterized protein YndB with AHSA1/START domain
MQSTTVPALVIRRVYHAPPERVYEAWTNPEIAKQFLGPYEVKAQEVEMDVRVGGAYHIVMLKPDGERLTARGTFREVIPGKRISMTWKWDEDDPKEEYETLLTLEFARAGGDTELTLTHERFPTLENRDNHEHGWTSIVDKLTAIVDASS